MTAGASLNLSGERFRVVYALRGSAADARAKAEIICLEQTVEFPAQLVPAGDIRDHIVGRIEAFDQAGDDAFSATISYAVETVGTELTQLLNVVFGNISLLPGIRVQRLDLSPGMLWKGPRYGRQGLRQRLGVPERPLLCTALKPMGLAADELAQLANIFARAGIDLIKDDHGLADQPFGGYHERVRACVAAVERANRETGRRCVYVPNVTAPAGEIVERARFAMAAGAGGLLVAPGLVGLDSMRRLADDDAIGLPILSHPALLGSYAISPDHGIAHAALFGQLARLAGADATIFPNYGGRFSFSREQCVAIAEAAAAPMGQLRPIFPAPGGGMSLDRVPEMLQVYGRDVILLIGGGLHSYGPDLGHNSRRFVRLVETL